MVGIAGGRLGEERKNWRKDHPHVRAPPHTPCIARHAHGRPPAASRWGACAHDARSRARVSSRRAGVCRQAGAERGRLLQHHVVGVRGPGEEGDRLGGRPLPDHDGVQRRVPEQATKVQVQPAHLSPKRTREPTIPLCRACTAFIALASYASGHAAHPHLSSQARASTVRPPLACARRSTRRAPSASRSSTRIRGGSPRSR